MVFRIQEPCNKHNDTNAAVMLGVISWSVCVKVSRCSRDSRRDLGHGLPSRDRQPPFRTEDTEPQAKAQCPPLSAESVGA